MADWEKFVWAEEATEATVALLASPAATAEELFGPLGTVEARVRAGAVVAAFDPLRHEGMVHRPRADVRRPDAVLDRRFG